MTVQIKRLKLTTNSTTTKKLIKPTERQSFTDKTIRRFHAHHFTMQLTNDFIRDAFSNQHQCT